MSARVTSRPMEMPKWVAEERRGRSGQGQEVMSERSLGRDRSSRGDDTEFILVDTEARKSGKGGDDGESRGDVRDMGADIAKSSAKA